MTSVSIYLAMLMLGSNVSTADVPKPPQVAVASAAVTMPAVTSPVAAPAVASTPGLPTAEAYTAMAAAKVTKTKSVQLTEEEQRFMDLVNYERATRGLSVLRLDPVLVEVSRKHSKEMCDLNYFNHVSPTPGMRTALNRYLAAIPRRPNWAYLGENLFYCSIVDVNRGHTCLMESHSHRENILNPKFERIGVGTYSDAKGQFWVTQMFLSSTD
jgi:uncharacterized protein YkwD